MLFYPYEKYVQQYRDTIESSLMPIYAKLYRLDFKTIPKIYIRKEPISTYDTRIEHYMDKIKKHRNYRVEYKYDVVNGNNFKYNQFSFRDNRINDIIEHKDVIAVEIHKTHMYFISYRDLLDYENKLIGKCIDTYDHSQMNNSIVVNTELSKYTKIKLHEKDKSTLYRDSIKDLDLDMYLVLLKMSDDYTGFTLEVPISKLDQVIEFAEDTKGLFK